ncbi:MAG: GNAT family N-acetyltransferase [Elusimicrobia bacterium]|nr:GNAT family N-acetyltransferase [Elusimicrobiota bacterium]
MKIELVPYRPDFAKLFFEWRKQPSATLHNPLEPMSIMDIDKMLASEGSDLAEPGFERYRWFIKTDDSVVGNVSIKNISRSMLYAEVGYGIDEQYQGLGIGTAAVRLLLQKTFQESSLRRLIAFVHDQNLASCRLLDRLGFRREGLLREHYLINGHPVNEVLFGLLKHQWRP